MASSSGSKEPTTAALLLSTLGAYSDLAKHLFASIENPSHQKTRTITDTAADKSWKLRGVSDVLAALREVDELLAQRIQLAHVHAANQATIEQLQAKARRRDRDTRQAILELSSINAELAEITRLSEDELASIARAAERPVGHATLLTYAQRLAKYTSAPPGYKLPQVASTSTTVKSEPTKAEQAGGDDGDAEADEIALGPDYNQYAKKAAAYYDPAIPSMPQEMPFPSDAMMRQGILNSADMLAGAPMAEQPAEDVAMDEQDELPVADFAASYSHLREQQQRQDEDEDAFDLDLN